MKKIFIWEGIKIDGVEECGVIEAENSASMTSIIRERGYIKHSVQSLSAVDTNSPLKTTDVLRVLEPLISLLDSGVSIEDTFDLLVRERLPKHIKYIFIFLRDAIQQGENLESAFRGLGPLFSHVFISMIKSVEKSGELRSGLKNLHSFYAAKDTQDREIEKLMRYPKTIIMVAFFVSLVVLIAIVPMFTNIYLLFGDDLPLITKGMVALSDLLTWNKTLTFGLLLVLIMASKIPRFSKINPITVTLRKLRSLLAGGNDFYLYSYAMLILLKSGISIREATIQAVESMSAKHRKHGMALADLLSRGYSFSESFAEIKWFPKVFRNIVSTAEKSGVLISGFEQILMYIARKREENFAKWSRLIEPVVMILLGAVILVLLLSIYLPIFDLGNRIS